jgi:hypothetical protein
VLPEIADTFLVKFSSIVGIRELPDETVLISDSRENVLQRLSPQSLTPQTIGRTGDGPGEYRRAGVLFPLRGDTTVMFDVRGQRLLALEGSRVVPEGLPVTGSRVPLLTPSASLIGVDTASFGYWALEVMFGHRFPGPDGTARSVDSLIILRVQRTGTGAADTIARLGAGEHIFTPMNGGTHARQVQPFLHDRAILFPDGWMAIAYQYPYRVDWLDREGRRILGPSNPSATPPLAAFPGSGTSLVTAPDGRLLVRRLEAGDSAATHYDVFDRTGRRAGVVQLAPNERIVGSGRDAIYIASTDALGLQTLIKRRWPSRS